MPSVARAINAIAEAMDEELRRREGIMTVDEALRIIRKDKSLGAASTNWNTDYVFYNRSEE